MSGQLRPLALNAPGFFGINTQESEVSLEAGYATEANNCIIDKYGRLGSRRGWLNVTTDNATMSDTAYLKTLMEFKDSTGTITYLSAGDGKLFKGQDVFTVLPVRNAANTGDVALVATADNWQSAVLNYGLGVGTESQAFFGQRGNPLLVYNDPGTGYVWQQVGDVGTVPTGLTTGNFDPNVVLSAFGRVWTADLSNNKQTIFYSRLLEGWDFAGAGSGILDISSVVGSNDEIVGLANHNGFLIIFCKNNILVYSGASDPTSMALADSIIGVGCIARDSIQNTGTDLLFLSQSGVRSLSRTVQEKSMPMREVSMNIRDDVVISISNNTMANVKSAYYERDAFYLLSFPATNTVYCFDTRAPLPNGSFRVTTWSDMSFTAYCSTESRTLLLGAIGGIAKYTGYTDNTASYLMSFFTSNTDANSPSSLKFLKKASFTTIGNNTQNYVVKYGFDYTTLFTSRVYASSSSEVPSEYSIAEYGIGEYTGGLLISEVRVNLGGSGSVIKFGVTTEVNGAPVSIQKAEIFYKLGKTY